LKFDVIICADTTRNVETLKGMFPYYAQMKNVKMDPRLQERHHRDLVGKTKTDIENEIGKKFTDRLSWHLYFEGTEKSDLTGRGYSKDESLKSVEERLRSLLRDLKGVNVVLLLGSSVTNQYILELLQYGTVGVSKPKLPDDSYVEFQENDELRVVTVDENMRLNGYLSIPSQQ